MALIKLRPPLGFFTQQMELVLRDNDHKTHWSGCSFEYLISRLVEETGELLRAIQTRDIGTKVLKEAVDVANFAMMISDNYFGNAEGESNASN